MIGTDLGPDIVVVHEGTFCVAVETGAMVLPRSLVSSLDTCREPTNSWRA